MSEDRTIYRRLQRHLDSMAVGYPRSLTGVEISLLGRLFDPREAEAALCMSGTFEPLEDICRRAAGRGLDTGECARRVDSMVKKGVIQERSRNGLVSYALLPLVVGMYEFQVKRLDRGLYDDTVKYLKQSYAIEYLTTAVPQMRVVPVERSVTPGLRIATYDEIRGIVDRAGDRLSVTECICKKSQDMAGEPCQRTGMREVCIALRDYHDTYSSRGWGRPITRDEAFAILEQAEREGLVIQTSNEQEPQFICACCGCCCGILSMMKFFPRPADFAAGNYRARVNRDDCTGCGLCVKRCGMEAVSVKEKKAVVAEGRCIGCGLCATACRPRAIVLENRERETVPPRNTDELYGTIKERRRSRPARVFSVFKALLGFRARTRS